MSIKLIKETPDVHKKFTAVEKIEFTVNDEASVDEMLEVYQDFMRACGYQIASNEAIIIDTME